MSSALVCRGLMRGRVYAANSRIPVVPGPALGRGSPGHVHSDETRWHGAFRVESARPLSSVWIQLSRLKSSLLSPVVFVGRQVSGKSTSSSGSSATSAKRCFASSPGRDVRAISCRAHLLPSIPCRGGHYTPDLGERRSRAVAASSIKVSESAGRHDSCSQGSRG